MLSGLLQGRIIVGLGVTALIASFFVKRYVDIALNYQQVEGKVISVSVDCLVQNGSNYVMDEKTHQVAYMPCDTAPRAAASAPFENPEIVRHIIVKINYMSPIDNTSHVAEYNKHHSDAVYNIGDVFNLYASIRDPQKYWSGWQ